MNDTKIVIAFTKFEWRSGRPKLYCYSHQLRRLLNDARIDDGSLIRYTLDERGQERVEILGK